MPNVELQMVEGMTTLEELYEFHVKEVRGAGTRCPDFEAGLSSCDGLAYQQGFVEREPPVLFMRLLRFANERDDQTGVWGQVRLNQPIEFQKQLGFLRSGPYRLAAVLLHHGRGPCSGHYTTVCWEGCIGGEDRYAWYDDAEVHSVQSWRAAWGTNYNGESLAQGAYILVYVRERFWGDRVGDGSERAPYQRDPHTVEVAKALFRGAAVP